MVTGSSSTGPLDRARSILLAALSTEVILLAVTGAALYFVYRPSDATAWNDIRASAGSVQISLLVRFVLINDVEVSPEVLVTWLAIHATLGGPVAGVLLTAAWTRHRRSVRPPMSSRPQPAKLPPALLDQGRVSGEPGTMRTG